MHLWILWGLGIGASQKEGNLQERVKRSFQETGSWRCHPEKYCHSSPGYVQCLSQQQQQQQHPLQLCWKCRITEHCIQRDLQLALVHVHNWGLLPERSKTALYQNQIFQFFVRLLNLTWEQLLRIFEHCLYQSIFHKVPTYVLMTPDHGVELEQMI